MGRAIIVNSPNLFANNNLGTALLVDKILVTSISITGAEDGILKGFYDFLSVSYTPSNTSMKGVKWEIVGNPEGITISGNGKVFVSDATTVESFTVKATSVYDNSITATKTISIVGGAIILNYQNLHNGNINSSEETSSAHQYVHYNSVINCTGGDILRVRFPAISPTYQTCVWYLKVVEFNTLTLPSNLMTKSSLDLTSYISYFPGYSSIPWKRDGSIVDYEIYDSSTVCVYVQIGLSTYDVCSSGYGQKLASINRLNWGLEFGVSEPVGYILKNPDE